MVYRCFKTEVILSNEQEAKFRKTIGVCRYVYNFYLATNRERYSNGEPFIGGMAFSKWMNNEYVRNNPEKAWIKDVSSKAVKQSIMSAENAYKRFFNGLSGYPNFKKKGRDDPSMYFVKPDAKQVIRCERHRIKIPTIGWVRLKEYGYIPTDGSIKNGVLFEMAGKFFVSVTVRIVDAVKNAPESQGIGIDLGLKEFATLSNGKVYTNINKTPEVRRLEKKLRREQRKLSRKYENLRNVILEEGEATQKNIQKQRLIVQRIYYKLDCIRTDYVNKVIAETVKTKPEYVTIENLNVTGMMRNRHISKAVSEQKFYEFRTRLESKCKECGIELRIADRFYPSSKICHNCGQVKKSLRLSDRTYVCDCGYKADRDYNAALNLRDTECYAVA